jgi:hypothetical protein
VVPTPKSSKRQVFIFKDCHYLGVDFFAFALLRGVLVKRR